jgi:transposase
LIKFACCKKTAKGREMQKRQMDRYESLLLPERIEDYVAPDAVVRVYDAFIESMDLRELGVDEDEQKRKMGASSFPIRVMLKLMCYGYSDGVFSSRKLESKLKSDTRYMWLCNGLKPDHVTIAEFRRKNIGALQKMLIETVKICAREGLIKGNQIFVDGSKIRGNCSIDKHRYTKELEEELAKVKKKIDEIEERDIKDSKEESLGKVKNIKEVLEHFIEYAKADGNGEAS